MVILGIDPGTRRTGYGLIETSPRLRVVEAGVIRLRDGQPLSDRLATLHTELATLLARFRPEITVVEKIFFGKNADSAFKLGHARGVCLALASMHSSHVEEYAAKFVKKAITGSGGATKEHVRLIVTRILDFQPASEELDLSDALALAVCHAQSLEVRRQMGRAAGQTLGGSA